MTTLPRVQAVPPVRNTSASSMQSPPASADATSVIILSPVLARPGARPRSKCRSTSWGRPRCKAREGSARHSAVVVRRCGCGRVGGVVASIGCSLFLVGQMHRSTFLRQPGRSGGVRSRSCSSRFGGAWPRTRVDAPISLRCSGVWPNHLAQEALERLRRHVLRSGVGVGRNVTYLAPSRAWCTTTPRPVSASGPATYGISTAVPSGTHSPDAISIPAHSSRDAGPTAVSFVIVRSLNIKARPNFSQTGTRSGISGVFGCDPDPLNASQECSHIKNSTCVLSCQIGEWGLRRDVVTEQGWT